jgi:hypothetical protein
MPVFKNGEPQGKTDPDWEVGTNGRREGIRKGCKRLNVVEIVCIHV